MMEDNNIKLLSDVVVYNKYAKYRASDERRETWEEIIDRYILMMLTKYCDKSIVKQFRNKKVKVEKDSLAYNIIKQSKFLYSKKVLPSMRALQFAGPAIEKNEARIYNCSYMPIDDYRAFGEIMFLLLGGTGVGYSVQFNHVQKLPEIQRPTKEAKYLIGDSIEGWSDAVKQLMKAYFGKTKVNPRFDYSDIRDKGEQLVTAGGKAPGPDPLRIALVKIESILNSKKNGEKLETIEVHDIICHIADAVLAGGIRRAALISLFSMDDNKMLTAKSGSWWELNPQRGRANNSAVILRNRVKKEEFLKIWKIVEESNAGEPGFYFTNDPEYGTNPCCEISLRPFTFCNLTEINAGTVESQKDFDERVEIASFYGTLQAGFTDFHYLRNKWKVNTEKDSLVGVGITGIGNNTLVDINLNSAAKIAKNTNTIVSDMIGINSAARVTTVKPSGTSSCVLGTSSGIHAWHSKYYVRNMQCKIGDDLYNHFKDNYPRLVTDMELMPDSAVIGIPQKAPEKAILRENQSALMFLDLVRKFNIDWVQAGHNRGPNTNNVSATVSIKQNEWTEVGEWMWNNKNSYNGLSVLPFDGGTYKNAPFMDIDKEEYDSLSQYIKDNPIDLTKIYEGTDNTDHKGQIACSGGSCEIV